MMKGVDGKVRNTQIINTNIYTNSTELEEQNLIFSKKMLNKSINSNVEDLLREITHLSSFINIKNKLDSRSTYKLILPKDIKNQIKKGILSQSSDQDGMLTGIIRNQKGEMIYHARLKELKPEVFETISELSIQSNLAQMVVKLEEISHQVNQILKGQHSDRIGIIKGAQETYNQALKVKNEENRIDLLKQAIVELNKGRSQLIESLKEKMHFVENLPSTKFEHIYYSLLNKVNVTKVTEAYFEIQEIFDGIIVSSILLGLTYEELGEKEAIWESIKTLIESVETYSLEIERLYEFLPYEMEQEAKSKIGLDLESITNYLEKSLNLDDYEYIELEVKGHQLICEVKNHDEMS